MIGDRIMEVNKFKLSYNGFFILDFEYANEKYSIKPYLTPEMLLKIIKNEGFKDLTRSLDFSSEGVCFTKTTLLFEVFDGDNNEISFLTSEEAEVIYLEFGISLINCKIKNEV